MTNRKRCPVCGLVQPAALDCRDCATSLLSVPLFDEANLARAIEEQGQPSRPGKTPEEIEKNRNEAQAASPATRRITFQGREGRLIKVKSGDTLGRASEGAEFFVDFPKVSRRHARVTYEDGQWIIEDLSSANGLFVDGRQVSRAPLELGADFSLSLSCELTVVSC